MDQELREIQKNGSRNYWHCVHDIDNAITTIVNRQTRSRDRFGSGFLVDFDIKVGSVDIPDIATKNLSDEDINEVFTLTAEAQVESFIEHLQKEYPKTIGECQQTGRSGGQLTVELKQLPSTDYELQEIAEQAKKNFESGVSPELEHSDCYADFIDAAEVLRTAETVREVEKATKKMVNSFVADIESDEFWHGVIKQQEIQNMRIYTNDDTYFVPPDKIGEDGRASGTWKKHNHGVLFRDREDRPIAYLVANSPNEIFFVSASEKDGDVWYSYGLSDKDREKLKLPESEVEEYELGRRIIQQVDPRPQNQREEEQQKRARSR